MRWIRTRMKESHVRTVSKSSSKRFGSDRYCSEEGRERQVSITVCAMAFRCREVPGSCHTHIHVHKMALNRDRDTGQDTCQLEHTSVKIVRPVSQDILQRIRRLGLGKESSLSWKLICAEEGACILSSQVFHTPSLKQHWS